MAEDKHTSQKASRKLLVIKKTPTRLAVICGGIVGAVLITSISFTAAISLPGQPLHGTKTTFESTRYLFTPSLIGRANVRIDQDEQRFWELQQLDKRPVS